MLDLLINMRTPLAQSQNIDKNQNTIVRTLSAQLELSSSLQKLNWAQIQRIMRVSNPDSRAYYIKETVENMWSYRTLDRNISTLYYQHLLSSQIKEPVVAEMEEKTKEYQQDKRN